MIFIYYIISWRKCAIYVLLSTVYNMAYWVWISLIRGSFTEESVVGWTKHMGRCEGKQALNFEIFLNSWYSNKKNKKDTGICCTWMFHVDKKKCRSKLRIYFLFLSSVVSNNQLSIPWIRDYDSTRIEDDFCPPRLFFIFRLPNLSAYIFKFTYTCAYAF